MTTSIKTIVAVAALALGSAAVPAQSASGALMAYQSNQGYRSNDISVRVDGKRVDFANTQPMEINNRVLVPLRGVFEQMGATVRWIPANREVVAMRGSDEVRLYIGDRTAHVNGRSVRLDVPARIIRGSTMVPIRFVSEALGADVGWLAASRLVTIDTSMANVGSGENSAEIYSEARNMKRVILPDNTVIPVKLNDKLTSTGSYRGETFTATVVANGDNYYGTIPEGAKVIGHVSAVHAMENGKPALIDLEFDRLTFPNGHTVPIDGELASLDADYVQRNANGVLMVKPDAKKESDKRMVFAGYGAGGGLLVGLLTHKPLEGAILGGVLGYLAGLAANTQNKPVSNITLSPGTEMGVRITQPVVANWG